MTLNNFIEDEMKKRDMSIREFSKLIGLSHSTISKFLNNPDTRNVSIEFLVKLAEGTNTDLASIVAMVYPEHTSINAQSRILAERIAQLPPAQYEMIESLLLGFGIKAGNGGIENTELLDG